MADYELHADYDRDGRLRATPAEYAGRQAPPGALLLPNLDVDARPRPNKVAGSPGDRRKLDGEQAAKSRRDDDLLPLRVRAAGPTARPGTKLSLRIAGPAAKKVRLYDARGLAITPASDSSSEYALTLKGGLLNLRLEVATLPGSPLVDEGDKPAQLRLELVRPTLGGRDEVLDKAYFSIAPFLIADNTAEVEEIYMCELADNEPARRDLAAALAQASLTKALRLIPAAQAQEDGWVQDQFQHGFCQTPGGWMHVIVHLPRLASNVMQVEAKPSPNLASFVTSHFPARNLGLFDDFWQRTVPMLGKQQEKGEKAKAPNLPFQSSYEVLLQMNAVENVRRTFLEVRDLLKLEIQRPEEPTTWLKGRIQLDKLAKAAVEKLTEKEKEAGTTRRKADLRSHRESLKSLVQTIDTILPLEGEGVKLTPPKGTPAVLNEDELDDLLERLQQVHSSVNYGGNIEASPPTSRFSLGKIVIGTSEVAEGGKSMDPSLYQFLDAQNAQPLVKVDTSWLEVGHVDELLTFVPDRRRNGSGFAILLASPGVALTILQTARDLHREGLPPGHEYKEKYFFSDYPRHTDQGKVPVSHLLRGKLWLHRHPRRALTVLDPPRIYRKLAEANSRLDSVTDRPFPELTYHSGPEVDRLYRAGISVHEILHFERDSQGTGVNSFIEQKLLSKLAEALGKGFPENSVRLLPVLFDTIDDVSLWDIGARQEQTVAFTPDLVNMQVLGEHLLIPRPFGPRMRPGDAAAVLRKVFTAIGMEQLGARVNARYFSGRKLNRTICWLRREEPISVDRPPVTRTDSAVRTIFQGISGVDDVVAMFRDGFPGQDEKEVRRRILKHNPNHFRADGTLRPGWRQLTIPENPNKNPQLAGTVDLFEAYTQVVAESLGLKVHWIDSWFYHVRLGGIHCGTNVIRRPPLKTQVPWWLVPPVKS